MNIPSALPRSTTFVSPVTTLTPASRAASATESSTRSNVSNGRPSSTMNESESQSGRAPDTARSFTVPHTARRPMSPPGKNRGLTTNESVVKAMRPASIGSVTLSWSGPFAPPSFPTIRSTSSFIRIPPPPCARRIRSFPLSAIGILTPFRVIARRRRRAARTRCLRRSEARSRAGGSAAASPARAPGRARRGTCSGTRLPRARRPRTRAPSRAPSPDRRRASPRRGETQPRRRRAPAPWPDRPTIAATTGTGSISR